MAARTIKFEGKTYQFPDDATEQEISEALAGVHDQSQGPPNAGLAGVSRPNNPILEASHDPSSPVYQDSPFHESTSAENLGGWVEEGPIKTGKGVKEMVTPGAFKRGVHDTISGVGTTAAPATAFAPPAALARSAVGSYLGSKIGESGSKAWGADEDTIQMVGDLGSIVGGYAGYKAPDIAAAPIRATGRVVQRASSMPDLPINIPSRSANIFSRVVNASRDAVSRGGRGMANYKVPQAPNVFDGDASGPLSGEPDLPTPVKPDGAAHHNDVDPKYAAVDGTTKLVGPVPPVTSYHGTPVTNIPSILREGIRPSSANIGEFDGNLHAFSSPDPSEALEFGSIRNEFMEDFAPGRPTSVIKLSTPRGQSHAGVDIGEFRDSEYFRDQSHAGADIGEFRDSEYLHPGGIPRSNIQEITTHIPPTSDEPIPLPESPLTKSFSPDNMPTPNSDTLLRAIKSAPGWPENGLPNEPWDDIHAGDELSHALDTDPYNRPPDQQVQSPSYTGAERRGFSRSIGGLTDAADNVDFQTAKGNLGSGATPSQVLLEAQRLKDIRSNKGGK